FEPVTGWYGGKTGALTRVHVEVMADASAQVTQYESGVFSLIGYGRQALAPAAATRYTSDGKVKGQLIRVPSGATVWGGVKFNAAAAKAEYQAWDPDGSKVKGLAYTYDTNGFNKAVCDNLAAQWKKNLGVTVGCVEMDRKTFFDQRNGACAYPMFRQSWTA